MGAGRKTRTFHLTEKQLPHMSSNCSGTARNLSKSNLAGVILGCKHSTIKECFSKKLFGLPGQHFSYIKNINPGLPLFLFNYSDRKLHGIFEAASDGRLNIDSNAWTEDGSDATPYPAQVRMRTRLLCRPLVEDEYGPIIADNYYEPPKLFWNELDQDQMNKLVELFSSSPVVEGNSLPKQMQKRNTLPDSSRTSEVWQEGDNNKTINGCHANTLGCMAPTLPHKPWTALFKDERREMALEDIASSDAYQIEVARDGSLPQKTWSTLFMSETAPSDGEMTGEDCSMSSDATMTKTETSYANQISIAAGMGTAFPEKPWSVSSEKGNGYGKREMIAEGSDPENSVADSEERMNSDTATLDVCSMVAKLSLELEGLKTSQSMQLQKISYLEQELVQSRNEIRQLKDRCKMLEYVSFPALDHLEEDGSELEVFNPCSGELILIGGFDGSSWLLGLDSYSPSQDVIESRSSMSAVRRYASAGKLNGELYIFGGANDSVWYDTVESYNPLTNQWTSRPPLKQKKGSIASVSLEDKIFAVGGGDGVECFSEVEMFDVDAGRWIPAQSMLHKRFAAAAAEINGVLYATGGYNGKEYLKSVERYDLREHSWAGLEGMTTKRGSHSLVVLNDKLYALGGYDGDKMVQTVEVFDPRAGSWMVEDSLNNSRGYFGAVVMGDAIYVIGGLDNDNQILDTVECFREGHGWQVSYPKAIGKRCFFSAVAV